jgi:hypothetical protein
VNGRLLNLALMAVVLAAIPASACKCVPAPAPAEMLAAHPLVFVGRAISGRFLGDDITNGKPYGREFVFRVEEILKGRADGRRVTIFTGAGGGDCGFDFIIGNQYLVYASESAGQFFTGLCDFTKEYLPEGRSEAATIRSLPKGEPGGDRPSPPR